MSLLLVKNSLKPRLPALILSRVFGTNAPCLLKKTEFPPRPKICEDDIEEVFIKGGGKGGQKINKTNSKVQLKHIPTGLVVSSQFSRSREQNRKKAREILALKIEELTAPPGESRTAIIGEYKKNKARKKKSKSKKKYAEREAAQAEALKDEQAEEIEPAAPQGDVPAEQAENRIEASGSTEANDTPKHTQV